MKDLQDEVREFCRGSGLRLHTDLGQHFLIDQEVLSVILEAAHIEGGDHVVEIGPGIGVLTRELLKKAAHVTAIEIDPRLIPLLQKFVEVTDHLTIIKGNALATSMPDAPYKIVANIPYHITSPLLRHVFLESRVHPKTLTLLIQREVAEKICDRKKSGMLTILIGLFGTPSINALVPPSAFLPPPKVKSAVLHVECFGEPKASARVIEQIFLLTKLAFSKKRKMLSNTLGALPGGDVLLSSTKIDPTRRPETLDVDEWLRLSEAFLQGEER